MSKADATEEEYSVEKVLNRRIRNGKVSKIFSYLNLDKTKKKHSCII